MKTNNIEEEFDEQFCYQNKNNEIIIRYEKCQSPKKLASDLRLFINQALTKAKEQGANEKYEQGWNEGSVYERERMLTIIHNIQMDCVKRGSGREIMNSWSCEHEDGWVLGADDFFSEILGLFAKKIT